MASSICSHSSLTQLQLAAVAVGLDRRQGRAGRAAVVVVAEVTVKFSSLLASAETPPDATTNIST